MAEGGGGEGEWLPRAEMQAAHHAAPLYTAGNPQLCLNQRDPREGGFYGIVSLIGQCSVPQNI